jgi:hypothetical protein
MAIPIPNLSFTGGAAAPTYSDLSGGVKISPVIISKNSFLFPLIFATIGVVIWMKLRK